MDIQQLRNLTTGRLHTEMDDIYQDIEYLTGKKGVMTHMLPNAYRALLPYLRVQTIAMHPRLWDGAHDPSHTGDIDVQPMNDREKAAFWERYSKLPSLI